MNSAITDEQIHAAEAAVFSKLPDHVKSSICVSGGYIRDVARAVLALNAAAVEPSQPAPDEEADLTIAYMAGFSKGKDAGRAEAASSTPAPAAPSGWQPIETAPKDGSDIIVMHVCIETQIVNAAFWMGEEDDDGDNPAGWWSYTHSEVSRALLDGWQSPTHWMPLPAPPAAIEASTKGAAS